MSGYREPFGSSFRSFAAAEVVGAAAVIMRVEAGRVW